MISLSSLPQNKKNQSQIVVGTVVTTNLYSLGRGVVYQIHGEQKPDTIEEMGGGVMVSGGNAEFDIVISAGDTVNVCRSVFCVACSGKF